MELIKSFSEETELEMEIVLMNQEIHYDEIKLLKIKIHCLQQHKWFPKFWMLYELLKISKKSQPDILHVWGNLPCLLSIPTKIVYRIPVVNNQITNAKKSNSSSLNFYWFNFLFSNRIVANSLAGLSAYNPPISKSSVIYNGFDFNRIRHLKNVSVVKKEFNIRTTFVVGMIASFTEKKDYFSYICAAQHVLETFKNVTFLCVGSKDYTNYKNQIASKFRENFIFEKERSDIESIMNICDIGVLLSNSEKHGEGISNSLLEFMALSTPIVATDSGGTNELVEENVNGYLIENKNHHSAGQKILTLLENDKLRFQFGLNSKRIVKEKFGIKRMSAEFNKLYEELI